MPEPVTPKKELKEFIKENGFFLHSNQIIELDLNAFRSNGEEEIKKETEGYKKVIRTNASVPDRDNILVRKGLAGETFGKGEKNRNGRRINPNAWDWANYKLNPQIFLQHNEEEPIGKALAMMPHENGIDILYYIDLSWLDDVKRERVRNGAYAGLSTGSMINAYEFEDIETGKMLDEGEVIEKYGEWEVYLAFFGMSDKLIIEVTETEALETSCCTLPSNPKALTFQDSLQKFFTNTAMKNPKYAALKEKMEKSKEELSGKTPEEIAAEKEAADAAEKEAAEKKEQEEKEKAEKESKEGKPEVGAKPDDSGAPGATSGETEPDGTAEEKLKWHQEQAAKRAVEAAKATTEEATELHEVLELMTESLVSVTTELASVKKALSNIPLKESATVGTNQFGELMNASAEERAKAGDSVTSESKEKPQMKFMESVKAALASRAR